MFHDYKSPNASFTKVKSKDESQWRLGWWDFQSLIEPPASQKPLQWSSGTILFTAHPTLPLVRASISSSKQFDLPTPPEIHTLRSMYKPPTVICACANDIWLFAFFPGIGQTPSVAVIWKRVLKADVWHVHESWTFEASGSVVSATWFGTEREWVIDETGTLVRLPPFGPQNPFNSPTLLLVTQSHRLYACYFGHKMNTLQTVSCSLTRADVAVQSSLSDNSSNDISYGPGGTRVCTKACIGLRYEDSSILVAMNSRLSPYPTEQSIVYGAMDLNTSLTLPPHITESGPSMEWELWGDEPTVELCAVQLGSDSKSLSLSSQPLPAIDLSRGSLCKMSFMCTTPTIKNSTTSVDDVGDIEKQGRIYLCTSTLDLRDYDSTPDSELVLHSFVPSRSTAGKMTWTVQYEAVRSYSSGVVSFFHPIREPTRLAKLGLLVGMLNTAGAIQRTTSEVIVGHMSVLNLPDLSDNEEWGRSSIMCPTSSFWKDLPTVAAPSPNDILVCTLSAFPESPACIRRLPSRSGIGSQTTEHLPPISSYLAAAIRARRSVTDLSLALSAPSIPHDHVSETLYHALRMLDASDGKTSDIWATEILGVAVEVYGMQLRRTENSDNAGLLPAKLQTAHEICSLAACNMAFQECKEGNGYDPDAIWQLITLCSWILSFLEKLMRDCVVSFASDTAVPTSKVEAGDDLFNSVSPTSPELDTSIWEFPALLHLVQPYALNNLYTALKHVVQFHDRLRVMPVKDNNILMAKDALLDLVRYSGINLNDLESLLSESLHEVRVISDDDARRSLALCQPTFSMLAILRETVHKLAKSDILDKALLFIKPSNFVNGDSWSPAVELEEKERDTISKGFMAKNGPIIRCRRCNGQSEIKEDDNHVSLRWNTWKKVWAARCICGGVWYTPTS